MIYISLLLFLLASICNAVMDTSVHHYSTSIFTKLNPLWWNGETSWKNKYVNGDSAQGRVKWLFGMNKPVQLTDAFHFFKMLMIVFICGSIVTFNPSLVFINLPIPWYTYLFVFFIYGFIWNMTFSLFYNKILRK